MDVKTIGVNSARLIAQARNAGMTVAADHAGRVISTRNAKMEHVNASLIVKARSVVITGAAGLAVHAREARNV